MGEVVYLVSCWLPITISILIASFTTFSYFLIEKEYAIYRRYEDLGITLIKDDYALPSPFQHDFSNEQLIATLGENNAKLFAQLDRDGNGLISIQEFEPLVHVVRENPLNEMKELWQESEKLFSQQSNDENKSNFIKLEYQWNLMETKSKNNLIEILPKNGIREIFLSDETIASAFLPPSTSLPHAGMSYKLSQIQHPMYPPNLLTKSRFLPGPYYDKRVQSLYEILRPFYPSIHVLSRNLNFQSQAVVLAENLDMMLIAFQLYPEILLINETESFWLTPPSLVGSVIIDHTGNHVSYFEMKQFGHFADIRSSRHETFEELNYLKINKFSIKSINRNDQFQNWTSSISFEEGLQKFETTDHKIRQINFISLLELENRLINKLNERYHIIVTHGNIFDHPCKGYCLQFHELLAHNQLLRNKLKENLFTNVWINAIDVIQTLTSKNIINMDENENNITQVPISNNLKNILNFINNQLTDEVIVLRVDPEFQLTENIEDKHITKLQNLSKLFHEEISKRKKYTFQNPSVMYPDDENTILQFQKDIAEEYLKFLQISL